MPELPLHSENPIEEPKEGVQAEVGREEAVGMPEDFTEPKDTKFEWSEIVENKELGVSYREKIIELPKHRQEETGIKIIRRRQLIQLPEGILRSQPKTGQRVVYLEGSDWKENLEGYDVQSEEFTPFWEYITDNRFPSESVWTHLFLGDWGNWDNHIKRFKQEGAYFQKVFPKKDGWPGCWFFGKDSSGNVQQESENHRIPEDEKELADTLALYDMSLNEKECFRPIIANPLFIFGNKNKAFVDYFDKISSNQEALRMIDLAEKGEDYNRLSSLISGKAISGEHHHPSIPVIRHPDIKPLRWCHSELAVMPTKKSLNVLFFDTEKKESKKDN